MRLPTRFYKQQSLLAGFAGVVCYLLPLLFTVNLKAQCNQLYNWTNWQNFAGTTATGTINNGGQNVTVSMTANYSFSSTPVIYNYAMFNGFAGAPPNTTVPRTTWSVGSGGTTTMCFNTTVTNPVLLFSSLGRPGLPVTLKFSKPYQAVFTGSGMTFVNDTTLIGREGFGVIVFPGNFTCVTIYSTTPEDYTNITWGLNPPLFPITVSGNPTGCDSVRLRASGGASYLWSGGAHPTSATNVFYNSGTYFLKVRDNNGCEVTEAHIVTVNRRAFLTVTETICEGAQVGGHSTSGTYIDTFQLPGRCDSIRTLHLTVLPKAITTISKTICEGNTYLGYSTQGTYIDTFFVPGKCDSVRTLNLTVLPLTRTTVAKTVCEGTAVWGHTTTGVFADTLSSATGCDTIRILQFTVLPKIRQTYIRTICSGDALYGYSTAGVYVDTFISALGCDSIRTLQLSVITRLRIAITETVCRGDVFMGPQVSGTYFDTVRSATLCDSIIKRVNRTVVENCEVHFPDAFTPNGDGRNEVFRSSSPLKLDAYECFIFNRWGEMVFKSADSFKGWDGSLNGKPQPTGVYVWMCRYKLSATPVRRKGTLLLLR